MNAPDEHNRLEAIVRGARAAGTLAMDTEFMGEGRYRTLLCLIQLATPDSSEGPAQITVLDPLPEDLDASELAEVLADPAIQVVVHAGRQDIALMRRRLNTDVTNVFDTQVAAGFVGLGAQSSYDSLLSEVLGVRLAKSASFTRWDTRPLSAEQLGYAREDVVHLLELAGELELRLRELGRLEWAREECQPLEGSSDERDPDAIFARLPRVAGLGASARPIARELVRWREQTAASADRPVQSVLSDVALMEIAKRKPSSRKELERIRGVGAGARHRRAEELVEVVRRASQQPPDPRPEQARAVTSRPEDAPLVALAEALLRARAREAGLAYELLASRADLQAIIAAWRARDREGTAAASGEGSASYGDDGDVRTMRGWRRQLVGEELLALLDGRVSLSVSEQRLQVAIRCGCKLRTAEGT
jgi:ribonuclease D